MMSIVSTQSKTSLAAPLSRAGLTLIELISAMAIFIILVGALIMGTNNAFDTWHGASARTRTLGRGRAALGCIVEDLLQATVISNAFVLAETARPDWAFDTEDEAGWSNQAEFDRAASAPSAVGTPPDGRVVWRVETTNNTAVLIREITYATGGVPRLTEALDGVTRLRFAAIWDDAEAAPATEIETNALPAAVDIFLELVPPDALRKAAGIANDTRKKAFLARQTLPLTTRVTFPQSRVPPLAISTNIVTLSGQVLQADGTGIAGVTLDLTGGLTDTAVTESEGAYTMTVRQTGRPIRVTPREPSGNAGRYTPQWRVWWPSSGSLDSADFVWRESDITISGRITIGDVAGAPVPDVILDFPMAGRAVTGNDGAYRIGVDSGWPYNGAEARVTPDHPRTPGGRFEAVGTGAAGEYHLFTDIMEDQTGRDFIWFPPDLVLTGEVVCAECATPLTSVRLRAAGDGIIRDDTTTDVGHYSIPVPYGWSGTLNAVWFWNDADDDTVGVFLDSPVRFETVTESAYTRFRWLPSAVVSGAVYRAVFDTNTFLHAFQLYTQCLDRAEIPAGNYPGRTAAISNGIYTIAAPHQWYHTGEDRILFINPNHSRSGDSHGVYSPAFARFTPPPLRNTSADFIWFPCDLFISGAVTNSLGGAVADQAVLFVSNCLDLAPTNAIEHVVITQLLTVVGVDENGVTTNATLPVPVPHVVFTQTANPLHPPPTTNLESSVEIQNGFAFLFNTSRHAFAETPWVYTATNGVYTNWVSLGWSGAILPVATNRTFVPPAVFVDNLVSNLTDVVFGGD